MPNEGVAEGRIGPPGVHTAFSVQRIGPVYRTVVETINRPQAHDGAADRAGHTFSA